ncbi:hypothetical protein PHYBOEH_001373 [Phytophthora boehmeriae]|uniref:Fibronectin type-III domain-containing protein n=1 Tax=Phytophthora boehmeriae TaxID=109152 RepID=A0A8T1X6T4_9STRA|nr:hypothetical protein PHYBOEH_001373 [Phytophthora boehmeriae]
MRHRWLLMLLALVSSGVCSAESADESVELVDENVAPTANPVATNDNHAKKTQSFVEATHGSAHALTLTTFLTDAAHLHYAVIPTGYAPLDAAAIKSAAEQCRLEVSEQSEEVQADRMTTRRLPGTNNAVGTAGTGNAVTASTVTVQKAQKVESAVEHLQPNTSYDVYFVAEVIGSNGVFGSVQSVLQSSTHPEPPMIDITAILPADASADTIAINATLTTPGKVYFALMPSGGSEEEEVISPAAFAANRSVVDKCVYALQTVTMGSTLLSFEKLVENLLPATLYDVLVMTEAPGDGEVRSEVIMYPQAVRTHALAPEVSFLRCSPQNASATALNVSFQLEVSPEDIRRVNPDTLSYFKYALHYEVTALSDGKANLDKTKDSSALDSAGVGKVQSNAGDISALKNVTVKGTFSIPSFDSVDDFHRGIQEIHHTSVEGLQSGTLYKINVRTETAGSSGLFGIRELTAQATTHEEAPTIISATAHATNKSVNSLSVTVGLARTSGNVHYLVSSKTGQANMLRSVFQQATSMGHLQDLMRERSPRDSMDGSYATGVFKFDSETSARSGNGDTSPDSNTNTANVEPGEIPAFEQKFEITGLEDATSYAIALLPETTSSFGVFGRAFNPLLEAATNENASAIELRSVDPLHGDISSIRLELSMSKPQDVLFLCISPAMAASTIPDQDTATHESLEPCREVEERDSFETSRNSPNLFTFNVGNLSEDTEYLVSVYAENVRRNGVLSDRTDEMPVKTHKTAPRILGMSAQPTAASTRQIDAHAVVEPNSPCLLHYVVREMVDSTEPGKDGVDAAAITRYTSESDANTQTRFQQQRLPPSSSSRSFITGGRIFEDTRMPNFTIDFKVLGLRNNTTYELIVVTETSRDGNSSGVLGEPVASNVTTHAIAPKIVLATVDPVDGSTNSVTISANLSHPGVLHYFLSDVDFADPAVISHIDRNNTPHELRGQLQVLDKHILMEVINGTNDTRPTDPPVFVHNITVDGLKSGVTYHVSLTTETNGSDGVFGEFPPPILVNTNLGPPLIIPETLSVGAVVGSSSALAIDFQLDRFGDVHYALFFRGLVPDRCQSLNNARQKNEDNPQVASSATDDNKNESTPVWPPPASSFDLTKLSGPILKAADFEELGEGVWENDTISVSREDVTRGKITHKEIDKLPPNALFDVCLVSETAASGGILGWPSTGSTSACHRIATHADYTNQSVMFDEIDVQPLRGRTDGIHVSLNISKLLAAPPTTDGADGSALNRFARATGRVPYFILLDAKAKHGRDLGSAFSSHRGEVTRAFKEAIPGKGDGVAAAGILANISAENATALQIEQDVYGLHANHEYLLFFTYETSDSDGVFTRVNPHKHRSNESRAENDGIPVTTHEAPPRIPKAQATPAFGHTSKISVKFNVACDSCTSALIHLLVFPEHCSIPSSVIKTLQLDKFSTSENDSITNSDPASASATSSIKDDCESPLVQKRVEIEMPERQHSRHDVEEELGDQHVLAPNTSYTVLLASETVGAQGVLSKHFEDPLRVRTHELSPSFTKLQLEPRSGSTTELLLTFALDRAGEVHYMLGVSGNADFNVTSPHNISSKGASSNDRHGHGRNSHDYHHDVVRTRRSVSYTGGEHIELLDHLTPGTSYSLFIVSEAAPADHGVYGAIHEVKEVSTFANAPILLAHAVYPTPGTTQSLTAGFRMDAPGIVYFSVVAVQPWIPAHHVAKGSDRYGNRLALEDHLVIQKRLEVDEMSMEVAHDSGWREQLLEVPRTGLNYTIHLVTETKGSGGIYGTVAIHTGVRAHSEAPEILDIAVSATDARVDGLSVNITISDRGHVHYIALPHGKNSVPPSDNILQQSTELSILASGSVDINETAESIQEKSFTITSLTEGTAYDLYFRTETLESFGVFGSWTRDAITTRTHGLPPDVLPEAVECNLMPSCDQRGRETCSRKPNVCGECLTGYTPATDDDETSAVEPCVKISTTSTGL